MLDEDVILAENACEDAIDFLRRAQSGENTSVSARNKYRKILKNELSFLKEYFSESHVLGVDISDINMQLEA